MSCNDAKRSEVIFLQGRLNNYSQQVLHTIIYFMKIQSQNIYWKKYSSPTPWKLNGGPLRNCNMVKMISYKVNYCIHFSKNPKVEFVFFVWYQWPCILTSNKKVRGILSAFSLGKRPRHTAIYIQGNNLYEYKINLA